MTEKENGLSDQPGKGAKLPAMKVGVNPLNIKLVIYTLYKLVHYHQASNLLALMRVNKLQG